MVWEKRGVKILGLLILFTSFFVSVAMVQFNTANPLNEGLK